MSGLIGTHCLGPHCEEPLRRSNPESLRGGTLDCFAVLAMTEREAFVVLHQLASEL
ncbi:hypothetical protein GWG67_20760 [Bradyrhizobium sp. CSS354]|nr:hypothetical protein [Bradyrhizobium sp. CSS354]